MHATLIQSSEIAPGVRHFEFEANGLDRFDYQPGQFVSLSKSIPDPGSGETQTIVRAYSLASAPGAGNRFELCLNLVEGGQLSPHLFAMRPGDRIDMQPPLGSFVLRNPDRDAVLIATGTGVAPFRSYLQAHIAHRPEETAGPTFALLFGVRYETHLLYRDEFEALERTRSRFHFVPTLTQPGPEWSGRTGRVQAHLEEVIAGRVDLDFYLCGMRAMVDEVRSILKGMGFDRKQIRAEKYD